MICVAILSSGLVSNMKACPFQLVISCDHFGTWVGTHLLLSRCVWWENPLMWVRNFPCLFWNMGMAGTHFPLVWIVLSFCKLGCYGHVVFLPTFIEVRNLRINKATTQNYSMKRESVSSTWNASLLSIFLNLQYVELRLYYVELQLFEVLSFNVSLI